LRKPTSSGRFGHNFSKDLLPTGVISPSASIAANEVGDGNPLEVAYRELDDGSLFVFHAMPSKMARSGK
jgi:hypothetical protein